MTEINELSSGDVLHNHNCYAYLQKLSPFVNDTILEFFPKLDLLKNLHDQSYDAKTAYGNIYSLVLSHLETHIDSIYPQLNEEQIKTVDALIFTIYHNDNYILEHADWLKAINKQIRPLDNNRGELVAHHLEDSVPPINYHSPKTEESLLRRFFTLFTPNFKPQLDTNIPSIKHHSYHSDLETIEYRFGTQAQRHHAQLRISPLFKRWLAISAEKTLPEQKIAHVYFNNLGLDRDQLDLPGSNERELSHALHQLELIPSLKIAVITLPASKALMHSDHYKRTNKNLSYAQVFEELFTIAQDEAHPKGVVDFKISPEIRDLLFGDSSTEILNKLLEKSFTAMGISEGTMLSQAQKQAVWLHFIKFELTDYILTTLKPTSCNFSCKDAIDRGALSSLYFNLHKSFLLQQPMNRDEFERNLDIAAAVVKGRGMNFHRRILWNALNEYVNTHYDTLLASPDTSWLIYWRDMNCPHSSTNQLLELRLSQYEQQLNTLPSNQKHIKEEGLKLLDSVQTHYKNQVSGQRLLLEVISRSAQFLSEKPSKESIKAYKNLADELRIKHPLLLVISGLMLTLLGAILLSNTLINRGISKVKAGFFVTKNNELSTHITNISLEKESSLSEEQKTEGPAHK